jgi:uncharacterized protein (DUF1684 family)
MNFHPLLPVFNDGSQDFENPFPVLKSAMEGGPFVPFGRKDVAEALREFEEIGEKLTKHFRMFRLRTTQKGTYGIEREGAKGDVRLDAFS